MPISPYIKNLRDLIGTSRLLLPSVNAIIYGAQGEILLVRQRDGDVWSTPGGAIEPDETPTDAVVREALEETGLTIEPVRLIGAFGGPNFVVRYPNGDETQYVMCIFECARICGELGTSNDEVTEARFISEKEFETLAVPEWTREVLPLCYARPLEPIIQKSRQS